MTDFKVGNKVKVIGNSMKPEHHFTDGTIGEVVSLNTPSGKSIDVEGNLTVEGVTAKVKQYVNPADLELVEEEPVSENFTTDDMMDFLESIGFEVIVIK